MLQHVLTSQRGARYNEESCRKWFGKFRDRHDVTRGESTDFRAIRDAAYSSASKLVLLQKVQVLAGHKVSRDGLSDAYIARNPEYVAEACQIIHAAYMT